MTEPCPKCRTRRTNAYGKHQCAVLRVLTPEMRAFVLKACGGKVRTNARTVFDLDCATVDRAVSGLNCSESTFAKLNRAYLRAQRQATQPERDTDGTEA